MRTRRVQLVLVMVFNAWAVLFAISAQAQPAVLSLHLQSQATATGIEVRLGDVADYLAGDAELWAQISAEPVATAPQQDTSISLTAQDILGLLAERGYAWQGIGISGARQVVISKTLHAIDPELLAAAVEDAIRIKLDAPVELLLLRELPSLQLPAAAMLSVRFPDKPGWWLPDAIEFHEGSRLVGVLPLSQYMRFKLPVQVALNDIAARTLLDPARLAVREMELTAGSECVPGSANVSGTTTRSAIDGGQVLKRSRLIQPFDVLRGQAVLLRLSLDGLEMEASSVALNDAYLGQRLTVKRASDNAKFTGLLCAGPVVVVQ